MSFTRSGSPSRRIAANRGDYGSAAARSLAEAPRPAPLLAPALPTVSPRMLWRRRAASRFPPFVNAPVMWCYLGRNAVWRAVKALGLEGAEVLVPAYHHGVEVEALVAAGACPRFYRVGRSWDVDLEDLESRIGPQTRALYLTHFAGFPGPAAELRALADRRGLQLIEDCALSLLSSDGPVPLGSTGDAAVFCLYKTLPLPHGGALTLSSVSARAAEAGLPRLQPAPIASTVSHTVASLLANLELRTGSVGAALRRALLSLGRLAFDTARVGRVGKGTAHFEARHVQLGMSPLARRLAEAQDLQSIVERRRDNYRLLLEGLREYFPPLFDGLPVGVSPLFYPLVVRDKATVLRELWERGIEAVDFWSTSHPACDLAEFPEVAWLRRSLVEVPCHQDLTPARMQRVLEIVRAAADSEPVRHRLPAA